MRLRLVLLVFAVCAACGGRIVDGPVGGDGGSDSDEAGGDGGTLPFPVCPAEPPDVGAPCSSAHQGCAYVTPSGNCIAYACDGTWRTAPEGC